MQELCNRQIHLLIEKNAGLKHRFVGRNKIASMPEEKRCKNYM